MFLYMKKADNICF